MLVDLRLPGMNGTEICKQVRAANLKTPIIVLSAIGEEVDKVLLLEIGADDYIVKPFGARELLARIRRCCAGPRRMRARCASSAPSRWISSGELSASEAIR